MTPHGQRVTLSCHAKINNLLQKSNPFLNICQLTVFAVNSTGITVSQAPFNLTSF